MALVVPIVAGMALLGQYLVAEGKEPRRLRNIRQDIDKSNIPNDDNIYNSDNWRNVDLEERRLANQYHRNAYEVGPENSNIIPQFYNQIYDQSSQNNVTPELYPGQPFQANSTGNFQLTKPHLESNNQIPNGTILPQGYNVAHDAIQKRKDDIYAGPMFEEYVNNPGVESFVDNNQVDNSGIANEVSLLTGLPMENTHNNMVPFFRGQIKQNMDFDKNEQKLETFTGVGDIINRNKRETTPFFELHRENIYGTPNTPDELRKERFFQSNLKTSLLPVPQIRVRSVKPEYIRPRFRNVDELRARTNPKITFEGRVQGPAKGPSSRGIQARVMKNRAPKHHYTGAERFGPGASSVNKHQIYENFENLKCTSRENQEEEYFGIAYASEAKGHRPHLRNHALTEKQLRERKSNGSCLQNGSIVQVYNQYKDGNNGTPGAEGVCDSLDFSHSEKSPKEISFGNLDANFEVPKRNNFDADSFRNLKYTNHFVNDFSKCSYQLPTQDREDTKFTTHDRNLTGVINRRFTKRPYDKPRATHRQTRQSRRNGNLTAVNHEKGAYQSVNVYAKPTIKETTLLKDYKGIAQKPNGKGDAMDRFNYKNAYLRGLKEATLSGYTPGREKSNMTVGSCDVNIQIKNQLSSDARNKGLYKEKAWVVPPTKDAYTLTKGVNKPDITNKRFDPYVLNSLNKNPFANKPIKMTPACEGTYGQTSVTVKTM